MYDRSNIKKDFKSLMDSNVSNMALQEADKKAKDPIIKKDAVPDSVEVLGTVSTEHKNRVSRFADLLNIGIKKIIYVKNSDEEQYVFVLKDGQKVMLSALSDIYVSLMP